MRSPVELETKIDHCPWRHQHIIFIKECDNCEIVTVGRWKFPGPGLGHTSAGVFMCPVLGGDTAATPARQTICLLVFVTAASWSVEWRLEPRLNYVAINIPPPTLQLGSAAPQS